MRSKYLFLDERHISAGQLAWQTADGRHVPLLAPEEPATRAFATGPQSVPTGVRLVVQRARRTDPFAMPAGMQRLGGASYPLVSYEEGRYTWRFFQTTYRTDDDLGAYTKVSPASRDVCCLESPDGFAWTETSRCPVEEFGQQGQDGGGFLIDPHGPAEQRYKGLYVSRPPKEQARELWERYRTLPRRHRDERARPDLLFCVYAVTSPDGRNWQTHRTPLMTGSTTTTSASTTTPSWPGTCSIPASTATTGAASRARRRATSGTGATRRRSSIRACTTT